MKIAVLGGSFNPLHVGHAMLADTIVKEMGYDKVLFVPTFIPPHKIKNNSVTPQQRLEMLKVFCEAEGNGHFEAEACEIDRGGVSYTVDTIKFLTEKYKNELEGKLAFVMGDELAAEFHKWKNPEEIVSMADLLITHRYPDIGTLEKTLFNNVPAGDYKGDFGLKFELENFPYECTYMEKPMLPVSSTEIRTRIGSGKSFRYLVPKSIADYIEQNGLYNELR